MVARFVYRRTSYVTDGENRTFPSSRLSVWHVNKVRHCSTNTSSRHGQLLAFKEEEEEENFHTTPLRRKDSYYRAAKMMRCFHFMVEPAKNFTAKIKESHKRAKNEKREPLDEDQLFIVDLARDLSRVCQRSAVLELIWNLDDTWPTSLCRVFILQWASMLESKKRPMQTDGWPEMDEVKQPDLINEQDLLEAKTVILNWIKDLRAQPEQSVWPGEPVAKVLDDLQSAWRWGRAPNLLTAMELVFWTLIVQRPDKDTIPQQWLMWKQRTQNIGAISYVPQPVWDWISDAAVEVTLDLDTANPDLLITDEKRMRCGFERKDVPNYHQRFDGWWCAVATEGFSSGRHYWEVEVGERDWRLGVAKESALRKGFKSLNTNTGYLSLRLERGTELKALTVPFTALPPGLIPRRVGIYLDYDRGQLSFYDVDRHLHIYTYNESFDDKLFPLFGTVEIIKDLVIKSPAVKTQCFCPASCLWG